MEQISPPPFPPSKKIVLYYIKFLRKKLNWHHYVVFPPSLLFASFSRPADFEGSSARSRGLTRFSELRSGYQPSSQASSFSNTEQNPSISTTSAELSSSSLTTATTTPAAAMVNVTSASATSHASSSSSSQSSSSQPSAPSTIISNRRVPVTISEHHASVTGIFRPATAFTSTAAMFVNQRRASPVNTLSRASPLSLSTGSSRPLLASLAQATQRQRHFAQSSRQQSLSLSLSLSQTRHDLSYTIMNSSLMPSKILFLCCYAFVFPSSPPSHFYAFFFHYN